MIGDFLKPPTDNLYKFMALSGLVAQLLIFVFIPWNVQRSIIARAESESSIEILKIESEDVARKKSDAERYLGRIQSERAVAEKRLAALQSQLDTDKQLPTAVRAPLVTEQKQMIAELDDRDKMEREILSTANEAIVNAHKKKAELTSRVKLANLQWKLGIVVTVMLGLLSCGGFLVTIKGFSLWFDRVQVFQDAILKKQVTLELAREGNSSHAAE